MSEILDRRYALRKRIRASCEGVLQRSDEREQRNRRNRCRRQFCPVCEDFISGTQNEVMKHMETCLRDPSSDDSEEGSTFDEYEWAGQRRVRATAFLEGGDSGFTSIKHGNEDEVLDIESELLHKLGPPQYTTADIIFPEAESAKEQSERDSLLLVLGHKKDFSNASKENIDAEEPSDPISLEKTEETDESSDIVVLQKQIKLLKLQNDELRNKTLCKICMDNYERPLVSLECWHAHCERCWMRTLGVKKLCPQCKVITNPEDLRKIYL